MGAVVVLFCVSAGCYRVFVPVLKTAGFFCANSRFGIGKGLANVAVNHGRWQELYHAKLERA